jgi:hypothetical protein
VGVVPRPQTMAGWYVTAFVVLGSTIVCGAVLVAKGIDPMRAHFWGTRGWVTVSACRWQDDDPDGWDCRGTFNSRGTTTIDDVRIRYLLPAEPVNPVETVVSGPHATTAWTPGPGLLLPITSGTFISGIVPFFTLYYRRKWRRERAGDK